MTDLPVSGVDPAAGRSAAQATAMAMARRRWPTASASCEQKLENPCLLELIWSYWHEEGMLVQTMNAISMRFQNRRGRADTGSPDAIRHRSAPAAGQLALGLHPGRAASAHASSRRAYEYDHHYGITAPGSGARHRFAPWTAGRSSIEAFHNLLHLCSIFFKADDDTTVIADGFPVMNAIREVHLVLAEGAQPVRRSAIDRPSGDARSSSGSLRAPEMREFLAAGSWCRIPKSGWTAWIRSKQTAGLDGHQPSPTSTIWPSSASRSCCRSVTATGATIHDPAAGGKLGALLAAGDPGLHPLIPGGDRNRSWHRKPAGRRSPIATCSHRCTCAAGWKSNMHNGPRPARLGWRSAAPPTGRRTQRRRPGHRGARAAPASWSSPRNSNERRRTVLDSYFVALSPSASGTPRAAHCDPGSDSPPGFPQRWQNRQSAVHDQPARFAVFAGAARPGSWPLLRYVHLAWDLLVVFWTNETGISDLYGRRRLSDYPVGHNARR